MVTEVCFSILVLLVVVQRLHELFKSAKNRQLLLRLGAREDGATRHYRAMQCLHATWLVSALGEVWWLRPPFMPAAFVVASMMFVTGQALRLSAMRALGQRWTTQILTLPGSAPVTTGIYRYLRHPNYMGVILEIAALPLLHSAYRTALLFTALNLVVLTIRIRKEEFALSSAYGADWRVLVQRPRLLPLGRRHCLAPFETAPESKQVPRFSREPWS